MFRAKRKADLDELELHGFSGLGMHFRLDRDFDALDARLDRGQLAWIGWSFAEGPIVFRRRAERSDPLAEELHSEAKTKYLRANDIYRAYNNKKLDYIPLNSVRRTCLYQTTFYEAFLWHKFFGGPAAPAANQPGKSYHNFGLAMDVDRSIDKALLEASLTAGGWTADKADEGWHFEPQGVPAFNKMKDYIRDAVSPLSQKYADEAMSVLKDRKYFESNQEPYKVEKQRLAAVLAELRREQVGLNARKQALSNKGLKLSKERLRIQNEKSSLVKLRDEIQRPYGDCPNGQPYDQCNHEDLKRQWTIRRQALRLEYEQRSEALVQDIARYQNDVTSYNAEREALDVDVKKFQDKQASFDQDFKAFEAKFSKLVAIEKRLTGWPEKRKELIVPIQAVVDTFPY